MSTVPPGMVDWTEFRDEKRMTAQVVIAIVNALTNLSNHNEMCHDYWMSELFNDNGTEVWDEWNEDNLALMEKDVMYAMIGF